MIGSLFSFILILFPFKSLDKPTRELLTQIDTIQVQYVAFACECPNWIFSKDSNKVNECETFHIQAFDEKFRIKDELIYNGNNFILIGQFYKFPQSTGAEDGGYARMFK